MLNEVKKNPRVSVKYLQKSLEHANITDESTIRKTLNKHGVHWRTPRKKTLLSKKTMLHVGSLQKCTWIFHNATGKIFCGQMKLQFSCLEGTPYWREKKAHQHKSLIPTLKYGGGSIMVWGCLSAWTACYHWRKNEFPSLSILYSRHPKDIAELKQFCKEEWSKIPPDHCAGLIRNYKKCLVEVISAKGSNSY